MPGGKWFGWGRTFLPTVEVLEGYMSAAGGTP
jgi:hypothetical protein